MEPRLGVGFAQNGEADARFAPAIDVDRAIGVFDRDGAAGLKGKKLFGCKLQRTLGVRRPNEKSGERNCNKRG